MILGGKKIYNSNSYWLAPDEVLNSDDEVNSSIKGSYSAEVWEYPSVIKAHISQEIAFKDGCCQPA